MGARYPAHIRQPDRYGNGNGARPGDFSPTRTNQYKEVAVWKIAEPDDDKIRANCWEMYHDPNLNQLEEQVPISNQTIAVAEANFRAARATRARRNFPPDTF